MDTIKTFKKVAKNLFIPIEKDDIKKLHDIILEILKDIIDFCNQNNLIYYFTGGSAIGVIREHGFIPWDDDIDLVMPRKDYNILSTYLINKYNFSIPKELWEVVKFDVGELKVLTVQDVDDFIYSVSSKPFSYYYKLFG